MSETLLQEAIAAARAGQRALARRLLMVVVRQNPASEQGWLWLSGVVDDPAHAASCLERVLSINPNNLQAQAGLRWARAQIGQQQATSSSAPAPPADTRQPAMPAPAAASLFSSSDIAGPSSSPSPWQTAPPVSARTPAEDTGRTVSLADLPPPPPLLEPLAHKASRQQPTTPATPEIAPSQPGATRAGRSPDPAVGPFASAVSASGASQFQPIAADLRGAADRTEQVMPPAEAAGFTLLLGAIAGLNATLWIVPEQGPQSFGVALALAGLSALIFSLSLLPAWLGMAGTLMVLSRGAFDKSKAPSVAAASLFPGFLAAAAFLSGVARYVLTGLERPLALLQLGLLALAVIAIPVALYKELRREPALSDRISVLLGAATVVALLLGGLGVVLGSTVLGGIP